MNAWVLSVILCSATPQPSGAVCMSRPFEYGISRALCMSERERLGRRFPRLQVQCTQDPQLVATLEEQHRRFLVSDRDPHHTSTLYLD